MHSISVEKEYQGQGYARKLIDIMFNYCSDKGITKIKQSPYTKQGKKKIKKVFKEVSQNYKNVSFFDTSKNSLFNWIKYKYEVQYIHIDTKKKVEV